jgi:hypothetical protein
MIVKTTTKIMALGIVLLELSACAVNGAPAPYGISPNETVAVTIDSATGGSIELSTGATIEIPAGALPPGVTTFTVTSSIEPAPREYETVSPVYTFEPEMVFAKPVKVSMPIRLPTGKSLSDMTMLWAPARGDRFDVVPTEFLSRGDSAFIAVSEVTRFGKAMCGEKLRDMAD